MAKPISQRAYARHRGVALRAVQKAIARGLPVTPDGKIDPDRADLWWAANTDLSTPSNSVTGTGGHAGAAARTAHVELAPHQIELQKAKAAQAIAKAHLLKLELDERRGASVPIAAVEAWLAERDRGIRDLLVGIPDRLATRVPAEHRRAFAEAIARVCDELARAPRPPLSSSKKNRRTRNS